MSQADFQLELKKRAVKHYLERRQVAVEQVYRQAKHLADDANGFLQQQPRRLPDRIAGQAFNADGSPAVGLLAVLERPTFSNDPADDDKQRWVTPHGYTDAVGVFTLPISRVPVPLGEARLVFQGAGGARASVELKAATLVNDDIGPIRLPTTLRPLRGSAAVTGPGNGAISTDAVELQAIKNATEAPAIELGEDDRTLSFGPNRGSIDQYAYSILVRLTDPLVGPASRVVGLSLANDRRIYALLKNLDFGLDSALAVDEVRDLLVQLLGGAEVAFRDRVAIQEPVDVSEFRDEIRSDPVSVPKASSLALGYVVNMRNVWLPAGYSLGDLVYSLPLAPGEEQRVAVVEQRAQRVVTDRETWTDEETLLQDERSDSSTDAVFTSAIDDVAVGGSSMSSTSHVWGVGGGVGAGGLAGKVLIGGGVAGGYGGSNVQGSSSAWQNNSRDIVNNANQQVTTSLSRQATARREASRVGVRLASATESDEVATKIVANYNHSHALTIQYWEVLRNYDVRTRVDDVQLVIMVPMELLPWLPPGQLETLPADPASLQRDSLIERYAVLLRYLDVIADTQLSGTTARADYRRGIEVAELLASDPTVVITTSQSGVGGIIDLWLQATVLPFEEITARVVFRDGRRTRNVVLQGTTAPIPQGLYGTFTELEQALRDRRQSDVVGLNARITLGARQSPRDIVRLEIDRRFESFSYTLNSGPESLADAGLIQDYRDLERTYGPNELEALLGPPRMWDIVAAVPFEDSQLPIVEGFTGEENAVRPGRSIALPVLRLPPVFSFDDILKLEALFQHVVRNAVAYSRAVWAAVSPDERAIMLERYTIGFPEGGLGDGTEEIPLLSCVINQLLGFFGNGMILPFQIPAQLAAEIGKTSAEIQDRLLAFHTDAFRHRQSSLTLPTRGVLAEAVLGTSNASEKIDLTRFWNWKDSLHRPASDPLTPLKGDVDDKSLLAATVAGPEALKRKDQTTMLSQILEQLKAEGATDAAAQSVLEKIIPTGAGASSTFSHNITGLAELAKVMSAAVDAAKEAQTTAVKEGSGLGKAAMQHLPKALEQAAAFNKAAAAGKTAGTGKETTTAITSLLEGGGSETDKKTLSAIGKQGNADQAVAFVKSLFEAKTGGEALKPFEVLDLTRKLVSLEGAAADQDYELKLGIWSLSKALGLEVGEPPAKPGGSSDGTDDGSTTPVPGSTGPSDNPSDSPGP